MDTLNNNIISLKDLVNENTRCIKQEMRGKFLDQSTQLHELNLEIRRLRLDMQENRSQLRLTIYRWILAFLVVLTCIMFAIYLFRK